MSGDPITASGAGGVDPATVHTLSALASALQRLRGSRSYADLDKAINPNRGREGPRLLPPSTLNNVLGGKSAPTRQTITRFLTACGLDGDAQAPWMAAWERVTTAHLRRPVGAVRVREARPRLLGVHASKQVDGAEGELPTYVPRDFDPELRAAINAAAEHGGLVLLVGGYSVGKTRTMFEAVRTELPEWWLIHPDAADIEPFRALADAPFPRTVVWLDELHSYLDNAGGLTVGLARRLVAAGNVLLATLTPHEYAGRTPARMPGRPDLHANDRELLDLANVIDIPEYFSTAERRRAETLAGDPCIRIALDTPDAGFTQVLTAGTEGKIDEYDGIVANPVLSPEVPKRLLADHVFGMTDAPQVRNEISGVVFGNVMQSRDVTVLLPSALPVAVAGLPAQPVFVGRERELARLTRTLRPAATDGGRGSPAVSTVAGLAGVGKTAIVVQAAHLAMEAGWFPGGVLMVDLRGYDLPEQRVTASTAIASLLGALGIPTEHIPPEEADRQRLWRSVLAERMTVGRRILIVADNASSSKQVRPLLPGISGHHVLVTSRHSLADLDGARLLELDVLPCAQAVSLLKRELAVANSEDDRVRTDPRAAEQLVRHCGGLPLAVRIAAALLASEGNQPLAELVVALADEKHRLEELDYDGSLAIRSAFDLSYHHLAASQARMFRLLALNPGTEISTEAATALVGLDVASGKRLLGQLRRAHLLLPGTARNRWRMHDLLHLYATDQAVHDADREAALERLLDFYLATARSAEQHLDRRLLPAERSSRFATRQAALNWLDTEYGNLVAAVTLAYKAERYSHVVQIPSSLLSYFMLRIRSNDWTTIHKLAVAAARNLDDRRSEGGALHDLGIGYGRLGHLDDALDHYCQSLRVHREVENRPGQGRVLTSLGIIYRKLGQPDKALDCCQQSLAIQRQVQDRHGEGMALNNIGILYRTFDRLNDALDCHQQALRTYREVRDRQGEGASLSNLGVIYQRLARPDKALRCHTKSLEIRRELDDRHGVGIVLTYIGDTYHQWGQQESAVRYWRQALSVFEVLPGVDAASRTGQLRALVSDVDFQA